MLQATVQIGMKHFLGKERRAGEVIGPDELGLVSQRVLDALVSDKHIVLSEEGSVPAEDRNVEFANRLDAIEQTQLRMEAKLDALLSDKPKRGRPPKAKTEASE